MLNLPPSRPQGNWEGIIQLARILRGPQGCPWDRSQSIEGLAGHLVEEAYEVLHASRGEGRSKLAEELGDVWFLLSLVQVAQEESGGLHLQEIAAGTVEKIVRRHPHVFGGAAQPDPRAATLQWEARKREEIERGPGAEGQGEDIENGSGGGPVDRIAFLPEPPTALPALLQAFRMQQKAAGYGFDWPGPEPVFAKVEEELQELRDAMDSPGEPGKIREEAGDLLFAAVNLLRLLGLDPEEALREASRKFRRRFNRMSVLAASDGQPIEKLDLDQLDTYWERSKLELSQSDAAGADTGPLPGREDSEPN